MQLWSTTMWFQSDASSTLSLEEERGNIYSKCFSPSSSFAMLLKHWPTKTQMFTVSQATKKENILGAKSKHWCISPADEQQQKILISMENLGNTCTLYCLSSISEHHWDWVIPLSYRGTFRLPQEPNMSITAATFVSAFHPLLIFPSSSNVVEANIHRLRKTTILTLHCSQHKQEHSKWYERIFCYLGPSENTWVCSANKNKFFLPFFLVILSNRATELYSPQL